MLGTVDPCITGVIVDYAQRISYVTIVKIFGCVSGFFPNVYHEQYWKFKVGIKINLIFNKKIFYIHYIYKLSEKNKKMTHHNHKIIIKWKVRNSLYFI